MWMRSFLVATVLLAPAIAMSDVKPTSKNVPTPEVSVPGPPPADKEDRPRTEPPSVTAEWIDGHWKWSGNKLLWFKGRWEEPPRPGALWQSVRWASDNGKWTFRDGYWVGGAKAKALSVFEPVEPKTPLIVAEQPLPLLLESSDPPPSPNAVLIRGHWHYNGETFAWVSGFWSAPKKGYSWMNDEWMHLADGKWRALPGHWVAEKP